MIGFGKVGSELWFPWQRIAPIDLQCEKHKKNLLLRNHKAKSYYILCVAMYNGPLYKSSLPCPWGPYGSRPGGVMGKTLNNLLLQNHKAQSFNILYVAMFSGPLYKSCQSCPWGYKWPRPGGHYLP